MTNQTTKNLLFCTIYTGIGGGETLNLNLMEALDPARYRLHSLTPRAGKFVEASAKLGVTTHTIPYRGTSTIFVPALWARFPIVAKLRAFLRDQHIDAILSDYHTLPFIVPAAEALNIPVLWNIMGWWFPIYPWQRAFFQHRVRHMIAITNAVKEKILGEPPKLPPDCIRVLIPGTNPTTFAPVSHAQPSPIRAQLGIGADVPLVAMAARFQAAKGHEYFLEAARLIAAAVPETRFAVAGDNTSSFKVPKD